jgi:hypothetical protein
MIEILVRIRHGWDDGRDKGAESFEVFAGAEACVKRFGVETEFVAGTRRPLEFRIELPRVAHEKFFFMFWHGWSASQKDFSTAHLPWRAVPGTFMLHCKKQDKSCGTVIYSP